MNNTKEALLRMAVKKFQQLFPNSHIRFSEIIGRRISHVTGSSYELLFHEKQEPIDSEIIAHYQCNETPSDAALQAFWQDLRQQLAHLESD